MNIDDYINQQLDEIDKEVKEDYDIREEAKYIAKQLLNNPKITVRYENEHADSIKDKYEEYELAIRSNSKNIILVALSITKQKAIHEYNKTALKPKVYTPMILNAEINNNFTYEETINTLVSAFLGKLKSRFKVEVLED